FWQREYGGDANVIGRELRLGDHPFEIIGVTPSNFFGMEVGRSFDLALPICAVTLVRGNDRFFSGIIWWLTVTGRLKPGWSLEQATAHVQAISPGIFEASLPPNYPPASVKDYLGSMLIAGPAGSGVSQLREKYETSLWLLLAIAALVLLIACANLANLLLARASARQREIAIRQALGASRARLIRQLLVESLVLAIAGTALGAALAQSLSRMLVAFLSGTGRPDLSAVRSRAGDPRDANGTWRGDEGKRARDYCRPRTIQFAAGAGSCAGRALACAGGGRASFFAQPRQFADSRHGVSPGRRAVGYGELSAFESSPGA